eukprot:Gb_17058 [translate_table: standard]
MGFRPGHQVDIPLCSCKRALKSILLSSQEHLSMRVMRRRGWYGVGSRKVDIPFKYGIQTAKWFAGVIELEIVQNLRDNCFEQQRPISLALQAFPCNLQPQLNQYMSKRINDNDLKSFVSHWPAQRWQEYKLLLQYCRNNGVRLIACGTPLEEMPLGVPVPQPIRSDSGYGSSMARKCFPSIHRLYLDRVCFLAVSGGDLLAEDLDKQLFAIAVAICSREALVVRRNCVRS